MLDNDLVDFVCRLPDRFKFRGGTGKILLRKTLGRHIPKEIVDLPKKGFGIPLAKWLREIPDPPPLLPVPGLSTEFAQTAWETHRNGQADHRLFLWTWWSLQSTLGALAD